MDERTCSVNDYGCGRPVVARTWCIAHYERWKKCGDVQPHIPFRERIAENATCSVSGCNRPMTKRRLCDGHYQRLLLTGAVGLTEFERVRKWSADGGCNVPACDRPIVAKGWCAPHFYRQLYTGDVQAGRPVKAASVAGRPCAAQHCAEIVKALGLCATHYRLAFVARIKADPERLAAWRAYHREFKAAEYRSHPDRVKARHRAWMRANPERAKMSDAAKRRKRRMAYAVPFTADQLAAKIRYWGARCWMCRSPWDSVDHVKPLSMGGWHALMNIRPACRPCNSRKGNRWPYLVTTR